MHVGLYADLNEVGMAASASVSTSWNHSNAQDFVSRSVVPEVGLRLQRMMLAKLPPAHINATRTIGSGIE